MEAEKQHDQFVKGIEGFKKEGLHHADTKEKNPLPDPQSKALFAWLCMVCTLNAVITDHLLGNHSKHVMKNGVHHSGFSEGFYCL